MLKLIGAAVFAALSLFGTTLSVQAQDITLTSRDSKVALSGTLLGFDGEFYRLRTEYGELTVDGSGVLCDGPGCPKLQDFVADFRSLERLRWGLLLCPR